MGALDVGRNDLCSCGSGRKYKYCCLDRKQTEDVVRTRLREAEGRVVPALFEYATRRWGAPFFNEAWAEFFAWNDVPEDPEAAPEFATLFLPWFVFLFVSGDNSSHSLSSFPDRPVGLVYVAEQGATIPELDRRLIEAACASPFTFYAVCDVVPGRHIEMRDILTGRQVRALEQSASTMVKAGTILFAQAVTIDDASIMLGCGPLQIPPDWGNHLIDFRQQIAKRRLPTASELLDYQIAVRECYLTISDRLRHPQPPRLQNTDGDPLLPTKLEFELRTSVEAAFERLKSITLADPEAVLDDAERADGVLVRVSLDWHKKGNRMHREWDNTILGHLTLERGRLVASVNSKRRADRLKRELAKRLGQAIVFVRSETEPIGPLLARNSEYDGQSADDDAPNDPEVQKLLADMTARHWAKWINEPVPALGNRTPRQAARTAIGRERLEALLADFSWKAEGMPPHLRVDVSALRRKLGM